MDIDATTTALVTGANRGIGLAYARALLARGAAVYAGMRHPEDVDVTALFGSAASRVHALRLDVTDTGQVDAAAAQARRVSLVVNNAGIALQQSLVDGDMAKIRAEFDVNVFGTLNVVRAFAPVLARAGGGTIVNMLSALALRTYPGATSYAATKAALWSMTDGIRLELAAQRTRVTGVFVGSVDTDMMAGYDVPKTDPGEVAATVLDAVQRGCDEVFVDDVARRSIQSLRSRSTT